MTVGCVVGGGIWGNNVCIVCEVNIDVCADAFCQNDGTCINDYICDCVIGYEGTDCEININDCVDFLCFNGGVCVDGVNGYICICAVGYEGDICEIVLVCFFWEVLYEIESNNTCEMLMFFGTDPENVFLYGVFDNFDDQ